MLLDRVVAEFDVVGLSLALNTLPRGLQVARALKRRRPDLPIVAGGPSASAFAHKLLGPCDAVMQGRAEVTLPRLLQAWLAAAHDGHGGEQSGAMRWSNPLPCPEIPGLIMRGAEGALVRQQGAIPSADGPTRYDLVEGFGPQTVREGLFGAPKPAVYSLFASTGCVRHCRFCQSPKQYVARAHDRVIADLEMILRLHDRRGLARFMLVDDCLFADLQATKELLRRIAHTTRGHAVSFAAQFHVQPTADDELMRLFREAHFTSLAIGFETVSAASLDHERKGTTPADNDLAIAQCRRHGIVPYGYFVVGFDTDTEETVQAVFDYIIARKIIAQVLPVGLMARDADGEPTSDAPRIFSDTSFGATVFVSHRPAQIAPDRLQELINKGTARITSLRRLRDFSTRYELEFLVGANRCFAVWQPAMKAHVGRLRGPDPD